MGGMRRIALLLPLLASLSLAGPALQIVGERDDVGTVRGIAAIAIGEGYLPYFFTLRQKVSGHVRVINLDMGTRSEGKLRGSIPVGIVRLGDAVVLASDVRGEITFASHRYSGGRLRPRQLGSVNVAGVAGHRVLRLTGTTTSPVLISATRTGLRIATPRSRKAADVQELKLGGVVAAVTPIYRTSRGVNAIAGVTMQEKVFRAELHNGRWTLAALRLANCGGFKARAAVALGGRLVFAGTWRGRASLAAIDLGAIRRAGRNPLRQLIPVPVSASVDLGAGDASHLAVLDGSHLAVAGTKSGRAWAAVVNADRGLRLTHETFMRGTRIDGLAVNPARKGWTMAVQNEQMRQYLLRHPRDPALPRNWDPFPRQDPEPYPEPDKPDRPDPGHGQPQPVPPRPQPQPVPTPVDPGDTRPVEAPGRLRLAILPRVAVDTRARIDTQIVLINLGARRVRATIRFVGNNGRVLTSITMRLRGGERLTVSALEKLKAAGVTSFDGWIRIDGCSRRDTVIDATRTSRGTSAPLTVHWR